MWLLKRIGGLYLVCSIIVCDGHNYSGRVIGVCG
jgi:hypothetical protein